MQGNDGLASFEPNSRRKQSLPAIEGVKDVGAQDEGGSDVQNIQSLASSLEVDNAQLVFRGAKTAWETGIKWTMPATMSFGKQIEKPLNILSVEVLRKDSAANGVRELEFAQLGRKDRKRRSPHDGRRGSSRGVRNEQGEKKTRVSVSRHAQAGVPVLPGCR